MNKENAAPPEPDIWLQDEESQGRADCGCILNADGWKGDEAGAAFFFCPLHAAASDLYLALREARRKWGGLHDIISDLVEDNKITEAMLPDDYKAVVQALLKAIDAEAYATDALNKAKSSKKGEPNWFA
jgi:hypothetical protein